MKEQCEIKDSVQRVFLDYDGTTVHFVPVKVAVDSKNTKEEIEQKVYAVLRQEGYFYNIPVHENMCEAARLMIADPRFEVFLCTCVITNCTAKRDKRKKLSEVIPELDDDHIIFVPDGLPKSDFIPDKRESDILIDDLTKNCREWHGKAIKFLNGINNTHGTWLSSGGRFCLCDESPEQIVARIAEYAFAAA